MGRTALLLVLLGVLGAGQATAAGTAGTSAAKGVRIAGFAFKPATLTVAKGTRVGFENEDSVAHTASGAAFDSKRIRAGDSFFRSFKQVGSFPYHCKIHPSMRGKIVVR